MEEEYHVERIVEHVIDKRGRKRYLVKWEDFDSDDNTWEPESNLQNCKGLLSQYWNNFKKQNQLPVQGPWENKIKCIESMTKEDDYLVYLIWKDGTKRVCPFSKLRYLAPLKIIDFFEKNRKDNK